MYETKKKSACFDHFTLQTPRKQQQQIVEIMKKKGFLASFILPGTLSSVLNFLIMCVVFERQEI